MIGIEGESGFQRIDGTPVPDTALSTTSTNSVQNKVVTDNLRSKRATSITTGTYAEKAASFYDLLETLNPTQLLNAYIDVHENATNPNHYVYKFVNKSISAGSNGYRFHQTQLNITNVSANIREIIVGNGDSNSKLYYMGLVGGSANFTLTDNSSTSTNYILDLYY